MVAYARGLQYWAEKLNLPRSLDLHPLAVSIVELRETVQEHVTFNHWGVVQGLGGDPSRIHKQVAPNHPI